MVGVRAVYKRVYPNRLTRKEVLDLKASILWFFIWSNEAVKGERFNHPGPLRGLDAGGVFRAFLRLDKGKFLQ